MWLIKMIVLWNSLAHGFLWSATTIDLLRSSDILPLCTFNICWYILIYFIDNEIIWGWLNLYCSPIWSSSFVPVQFYQYLSYFRFQYFRYFHIFVYYRSSFYVTDVFSDIFIPSLNYFFFPWLWTIPLYILCTLLRWKSFYGLLFQFFYAYSWYRWCLSSCLYTSLSHFYFADLHLL